MRQHVLIYYYCMSTEPCDRFNRFVNSTDYKFATVETKDDVNVLSVTGLGQHEEGLPGRTRLGHHRPLLRKDEAGCPENKSRILARGLDVATG